MKLITWNCGGAFRKKFEAVSELNGDIYVIQECEDPKKCTSKKYQDWSSNHLWIGDNKNKGLGVFAKPEIELKPLDWSSIFKDHTVKYFLPCRVHDSFNLLGVWTHYNNSPNFGYMGQFWKYLQINKSKMNSIVIAGDFNSNSIWDQWDRWWNHSDVIKDLQESNILSLYHEFYQETQGKETIPTFYHQRKIEKPYHIDYFFASHEFTQGLKSFEIGSQESWLNLSDHMPILIDLQTNFTFNQFRL